MTLVAERFSEPTQPDKYTFAVTARKLEKWVLALVAISLLLANFIFVLAFRALWVVAVVLALGGFMWLGYTLMHSREKKYTDPYDLDLLREIDERESFRAAGEQRVDPRADVVCPHCGHLYGSQLKVCPACRRSP